MAQWEDKAGAGRLTIQPQQMTLGTQNPAAGEYPLHTVSDAIVSVSPQCSGAHRCPLFVFLPGMGQPAQEVTNWLRPVADKYGMIVLAPTSYTPDVMDAALKEVLQTFAIDPKKIAIIGRCGSGWAGMRFGVDNPAVFSRIAMISGSAYPAEGPQDTTVPILLDAGVLEASSVLNVVPLWRRNGNPVTGILGLRGHEHQVEDYDFLGRWLTDSWATPDRARWAPPQTVADPLPLLTTESMAKMTAFWTRFEQEPASIRDTLRRQYLRPVALSMGHAHPSMVLMNMTALAAHSPAVAADLRAAGLTAQQHDAYRVAIISAYVSTQLINEHLNGHPPVFHNEKGGGEKYGGELGPIPATSVLGQNIAFVNSHPEEFQTLAHAGLTHPENLEDPALGGAASRFPPNPPDWMKRINGFAMSYSRPSPAFAAQYGPMGFWRTP